jgi:hypothetical protein
MTAISKAKGFINAKNLIEPNCSGLYITGVIKKRIGNAAVISGSTSLNLTEIIEMKAEIHKRLRIRMKKPGMKNNCSYPNLGGKISNTIKIATALWKKLIVDLATTSQEKKRNGVFTFLIVCDCLIIATALSDTQPAINCHVTNPIVKDGSRVDWSI